MVLLFFAVSSSTPFARAQGGKLEVTAGSRPVGSVLAAGSGEKNLGEWIFSGVGISSDIEVTDLDFAADHNGDSSADNLSIEKLRLFIVDDFIAEAPLVSGIAHFNLTENEQIKIEKGGGVRLTVKALFGEIPQTNIRVRLVLYGLEAKDEEGDISSVIGLDDRIVGMTDPKYSSTRYSFCTPGNMFIITESRPVFSSNFNVTGDQNCIYAFDVYAEGGDVSLKQIKLIASGTYNGRSINTGNCYLAGVIEPSSQKVYRDDEKQEAEISVSMFEHDGINIIFSEVQNIEEGETATFVYSVSLRVFKDNDFFSLQLMGAAKDYRAASSLNQTTDIEGLIWSDNSSDVSWMNSYLINELPLTPIFVNFFSNENNTSYQDNNPSFSGPDFIYNYKGLALGGLAFTVVNVFIHIFFKRKTKNETPSLEF